jgi:HD-like signal output (HDOD) protein
MASFWRHSVLCAVAAGQIAARRDRSREDTPFIAGLLHEIGQLVLFGQVESAG